MEVIRRGGVVLHPTDTVFGLAAPAFNLRALRRLGFLKGRRPQSPFLVLASPEGISEIVSHIPLSLREMWGDFLKYPITAILPSKVRFPYITREGKIAVRIPDDEFLRKALRDLGFPIASTSANLSGQVFSPSRALSYFLPMVDLVIWGEERDPRPSTIVDFTGTYPRLVRAGSYLPPGLRLFP